ncbi:MAG: MBOAT family protein [Clostridia bacterium]|nr:MBOAT family protein [Clostridia bacterium]
MVFSSLFFLYIFLPLNLILYFTMKDMKAKNAVLLAFSLFFYAWGEPIFVFIMLGTALLDYLHSRFIEAHRGTRAARISLTLAIITDLAILASFKYLGFIVSNLNALPFINLPMPGVGLPIGISFYTFQTLTYVVDVYRGKVKAQQNYFKYLLYITSYFQLVAGPIVRYEYFEKALDKRESTLEGITYGIQRFIMGLAKKVIIANSLGEIVTRYMEQGDITQLPVLAAWVGMFAFTLQLYFDFSGYSDMAIGLGSIFGFKFPENFNYPYISKSVSEFWRRWHMTLGSFFRDYVYIPLGGNRKRVYFNLAVVWFLTGLWHGASWNFVFWGVYNGIFIAIERYLKNKREAEGAPVGFLGAHPRLHTVLSHAYLVLCVSFGFVLFKFTDMTRLGQYLGALFGFFTRPFTSRDFAVEFSNNFLLFIVAILLCMPIYKVMEKLTALLEKDSAVSVAVIGAVRIAFTVFVLVASTMLLVGNSFNPFLYFAF